MIRYIFERGARYGGMFSYAIIILCFAAFSDIYFRFSLFMLLLFYDARRHTSLSCRHIYRRRRFPRAIIIWIWCLPYMVGRSTSRYSVFFSRHACGFLRDVFAACRAARTRFFMRHYGCRFLHWYMIWGDTPPYIFLRRAIFCCRLLPLYDIWKIQIYEDIGLIYTQDIYAALSRRFFIFQEMRWYERYRAVMPPSALASRRHYMRFAARRAAAAARDISLPFFIRYYAMIYDYVPSLYVTRYDAPLFFLFHRGVACRLYIIHYDARHAAEALCLKRGRYLYSLRDRYLCGRRRQSARCFFIYCDIWVRALRLFLRFVYTPNAFYDIIYLCWYIY